MIINIIMPVEEEKTTFSDFLNKANLKMTAQRALILEVFLKKEGHLTAEELYDIIKKKDPSIGQATVYRTMKLLHESGIAREVDFGDGTIRYEHKYGHKHHDHLICKKCNTNIEVFDQHIEDLQESLAKKHGFLLTGHNMYLYGICSTCRKRR